MCKGGPCATAKAPIVVGDPSYFPGKCRRVGQVVRALCILSHPIPNCGDSHSVQIILPQKQTGRQTDMYVFGCSWVGAEVGGGRGGPARAASLSARPHVVDIVVVVSRHNT